MTHDTAELEVDPRRVVRCSGVPTGPFYFRLSDEAFEVARTAKRCHCGILARGTHVHPKEGRFVVYRNERIEQAGSL